MPKPRFARGKLVHIPLRYEKLSYGVFGIRKPKGQATRQAELCSPPFTVRSRDRSSSSYIILYNKKIVFFTRVPNPHS